MANITKLYTVSRKGKYGLKRWSDKKLLIPMEYDYITKYDDFFLLAKDSKIGLSKIVVDENSVCSVDTIVPCEYIFFNSSGGNTLLIQNDEGIRYYNIKKDKLSDFYEKIFTSDTYNYIQAHTMDMFFIIDKETDEIIFQIENDFKKGRSKTPRLLCNMFLINMLNTTPGTSEITNQ